MSRRDSMLREMGIAPLWRDRASPSPQQAAVEALLNAQAPVAPARVEAAPARPVTPVVTPVAAPSTAVSAAGLGWDELEQRIRGESLEPSGRVTIGVLPSISSSLTGRLFSDMRARHPQVSLKILEGSSGQVEEWLADARVDIAILYRYTPTLPAQEQSLAVVESYLIGCKGDRLTAQPQVSFQALDGVPFILPSAPNGLRTTMDALARQLHIQLEPVIEADSLPLQKSLTAHERLYTVLPLHAVWHEVREGSLQAARIVDPPMQRVIAMIGAKSKGPSRAVSAVEAGIRAIVEAMAADGMWHAGS